MTTESFQSMLRASPFRPFMIHLVDGRSVAVTHPESVAYAGGRTALVALPNDGFEFIDLHLVASLAGVGSPAGQGRA